MGINLLVLLLFTGLHTASASHFQSWIRGNFRLATRIYWQGLFQVDILAQFYALVPGLCRPELADAVRSARGLTGLDTEADVASRNQPVFDKLREHTRPILTGGLGYPPADAERALGRAEGMLMRTCHDGHWLRLCLLLETAPTYAAVVGALCASDLPPEELQAWLDAEEPCSAIYGGALRHWHGLQRSRRPSTSASEPPPAQRLSEIFGGLSQSPAVSIPSPSPRHIPGAVPSPHTRSRRPPDPGPPFDPPWRGAGMRVPVLRKSSSIQRQRRYRPMNEDEEPPPVPSQSCPVCHTAATGPNDAEDRAQATARDRYLLLHLGAFGYQHVPWLCLTHLMVDWPRVAAAAAALPAPKIVQLFVCGIVSLVFAAFAVPDAVRAVRRCRRACRALPGPGGGRAAPLQLAVGAVGDSGMRLVWRCAAACHGFWVTLGSGPAAGAAAAGYRVEVVPYCAQSAATWYSLQFTGGRSDVWYHVTVQCVGAEGHPLNTVGHVFQLQPPSSDVGVRAPAGLGLQRAAPLDELQAGPDCVPAPPPPPAFPSRAFALPPPGAHSLP